MAPVVPAAAAWPRTPADLQALARASTRHRIPLRVRGNGFSVDGQTLTRGVVVDMGAFTGVEVDVQRRTARAGAGATWREVIAATLRHGLIPPVVVDFLDLTVGGTLSIGGIAGSSSRHGMQVDNVEELEVVTRSGQHVRCGPTRHAGLFARTLAGHGRHAIIVAADLTLVTAPRAVRRVRATYPTASALITGQRALAAAWDHVDGRVGFDETGRLQYTLDAAHDADRSPEAMPSGALSVSVDATSVAEFLGRADPAIAAQRRSGAWTWPHPRVTYLLPYTPGRSLAADLICRLAPEDLGAGGSVLLYPLRAASIRHHPRPPGETLLVMGLQRTVSPAAAGLLDRLRGANADVNRRALGIGGIRYGVADDSNTPPRVAAWGPAGQVTRRGRGGKAASSTRRGSKDLG